MADVQARTAPLWRPPFDSRRSKNPVQLLHHSVSLGHLSDAELEALETFAQARLLAAKG